MGRAVRRTIFSGARIVEYSVECLVGGGDVAFKVLFALAVHRRGSELAAVVGVVLVLPNPLRSHHAPAPSGVAGFHFAENAWVLGGEIGALLGIFFQIEQDLASRPFVDQFPISHAQGVFRA